MLNSEDTNDRNSNQYLNHIMFIDTLSWHGVHQLSHITSHHREIREERI